VSTTPKNLLRRRTVLLGGGALALGALVRSCASRSDDAQQPRPTAGTDGIDRREYRSIPPESGRIILDPARIPKTFSEAPLLAELVRSGQLPPVQQRIGLDPLVVEPLHEIGRYGGTLRRAFIGPADYHNATRFAAGPDGLLFWTHDWQTIVPNIARAFELSRDGRVLTVLLRRGMHWSDGAPFTADDVMFWYTHMYSDRRVVAQPTATLQVRGRNVVIEKVDASTVQFIAPAPYPMLAEMLACYTDISGPSATGRTGMGGYAPQHYLSRFHPAFASEAQVIREAREAGFANWAMYLKSRNDWALNEELPVLSPWRVVSPVNRPNFVLERNPYSIWVDTAGQQLPYIDRLDHLQCLSSDAISFKAVSGQLDFQDRHLQISRLPYLLSNRHRSQYEVYLNPYEGPDLGIRFNLAYAEDAEIGSLLRTKSFRRALSLGIDREAIIETFMFGTGYPTAAVPVPDNKYYPGAQWATRWATLDLPQANRLLDEIGLTRRDAQGYRQRRDGRGRLRLVCPAYATHFDYPLIGDMVKDQWRRIGIDLEVQVLDGILWVQRSMAGTLQLSIHATGSEDPFTWPDLLFPFNPNGHAGMIGADYARWFQSQGAVGREPPAELRAMMDLWHVGMAAPEHERIEIGRELIRLHVDNVVTIGLVSGSLSFYGIHIAKRNLGNVPRRVLNTQVLRSPVNALPMTFFFKS
jgi:peptide/nickel transport system substrate-binding protein